MVHQHHERLDGTGYPLGLKGDAIALEARIIAVADTVEAMASHRPYRPGLGIDRALQEIQDKRGSWFEPAAVDACVRLFRDKGFTFEKGTL
jgi:HD-GYP domain-containing protein (c-di-GMP phosphodiesterase class II)